MQELESRNLKNQMYPDRFDKKWLYGKINEIMRQRKSSGQTALVFDPQN